MSQDWRAICCRMVQLPLELSTQLLVCSAKELDMWMSKFMNQCLCHYMRPKEFILKLQLQLFHMENLHTFFHLCLILVAVIATMESQTILLQMNNSFVSILYKIVAVYGLVTSCLVSTFPTAHYDIKSRRLLQKITVMNDTTSTVHREKRLLLIPWFTYS